VTRRFPVLIGAGSLPSHGHSPSRSRSPLALLSFFALRRHWTWLVASVLMIGVFCLLPVVVLGTRCDRSTSKLEGVSGPRASRRARSRLDFSLGGTIAFITRAPLTPLLRLSAAAIVLGWIIPWTPATPRRSFAPFGL
jgi:hypothetical protein